MEDKNNEKGNYKTYDAQRAQSRANISLKLSCR